MIVWCIYIPYLNFTYIQNTLGNLYIFKFYSVRTRIILNYSYINKAELKLYNVIEMNFERLYSQRFSNCGPRITRGPRSVSLFFLKFPAFTYIFLKRRWLNCVSYTIDENLRPRRVHKSNIKLFLRIMQIIKVVRPLKKFKRHSHKKKKMHFTKWLFYAVL